jgi:hypothetical protein
MSRQDSSALGYIKTYFEAIHETNTYLKYLRSYIHRYLILNVFLASLEFELCVSHLLGRHSATWAIQLARSLTILTHEIFQANKILYFSLRSKNTCRIILMSAHCWRKNYCLSYIFLILILCFEIELQNLSKNTHKNRQWNKKKILCCFLNKFCIKTLTQQKTPKPYNFKNRQYMLNRHGWALRENRRKSCSANQVPDRTTSPHQWSHIP